MPPPALLQRVRHGEAAGVIFFSDNVRSRQSLRQAVAELDRADGESGVRAPLLLMTDQEGGQVRRLPGPPFNSEKEIGESQHALELAADAGRSAAANLGASGLNVNLAPVLDVYREPGGLLGQYERSYSSSPPIVSRLGAAFIQAQQAAGVAATAKHFPGLGGATAAENTDERPVTLRLPATTLRGIDEAPFHTASAAGVDLIMLSWAVYPYLDPRRPAGLSSVIVRHELRERVGFQGITITDSIGAGALTSFGGTERRALLAAIAGDDLILCSARHPEEDSPEIGSSAQHGLELALAKGELSQAEAVSIASSLLTLRRSL